MSKELSMNVGQTILLIRSQVSWGWVSVVWQNNCNLAVNGAKVKTSFQHISTQPWNVLGPSFQHNHENLLGLVGADRNAFKSHFSLYAQKNVFIFYKCLFPERKGENPKQALQYQHRACHGAQSHKIITWAGTKSWMLNRLSHPGPPRKMF